MAFTASRTGALRLTQPLVVPGKDTVIPITQAVKDNDWPDLLPLQST